MIVRLIFFFFFFCNIPGRHRTVPISRRGGGAGSKVKSGRRHWRHTIQMSIPLRLVPNINYSSVLGDALKFTLKLLLTTTIHSNY
jgi:hypothetical protein